MDGTVNWLVGAAKALLVLMAVVLLCLLLWCITSPFPYGLRWSIEQTGIGRFFAYRRIARLTRRTFSWPGRAFRTVRAWFEGPLGHGSVSVVIDERLKRLKQAMVSTREGVQRAIQTIDGLGGTDGPAVVTKDIQALQARTEEVAKLGGAIDEDIAKAYDGRARSITNLMLGLFFGTAFALGNGLILSQFYRSFISVYVLPGLPLAVPLSIISVIMEMGLGWLVAASSFGDDAKRHLPLRYSILIAIALVGLVEFTIFGLLSYNFEIEATIFTAHAWLRYWLAPFGVVFVIATTATGYMVHRSLDQLAEHNGVGRLRREIKDTNAFVQDLPIRWDAIASKARSAEAAIDSYVNALGGKDGALRGAIDQIRTEREALNTAMADSHIDDWPQIAAAADGDRRRDSALNVGLMLVTLIALMAFCAALSWLLARGWPAGIVPWFAWWPLAALVTLAVYALGLLPFERLHYGAENGRVFPLRTGTAEYLVASIIGGSCAVGLLWASVRAAGWLGLFIGLLFIAGAAGVALLGYFAERGIRGALIALAVVVATGVAACVVLLALTLSAALWTGFVVYWPLMAILWFLGLPTHMLVGWWQRRPARAAVTA